MLTAKDIFVVGVAGGSGSGKTPLILGSVKIHGLVLGNQSVGYVLYNS